MSEQTSIAIIGGGPSGLMAAETLSRAGFQVTVYDRKPSVARKFLMAGRGGLNITHSENLDIFLSRYGASQDRLSKVINLFTPENLRQWCLDLGENTLVGSSGRVFPESFKASPLLRAWLKRLSTAGVVFKTSHNWVGWDETGNVVFDVNEQKTAIKPDATLLALGGASWPNLGSDGSWVKTLCDRQVAVSELEPSNCGFFVPWSDIFKSRFAGQPLKTTTLSFDGHTADGDIMISENGIEGGPVYALSAKIRDALKQGEITLNIDLRPAQSLAAILQKVKVPRRRQSFSTYLQKHLNLPPVAVNLLRESDLNIADYPPEKLAATIKSLPLKVTAPFPIARVISTAGGISFNALNEDFMIRSMPGVFAAGEMLDWEAPTGGYLLQACFATGQAAANGIINYLKCAHDGADGR